MDFLVKAPEHTDNTGEYILDYTVGTGHYEQKCATLEDALTYAFRLIDDEQGHPVSISYQDEIVKTQEEILTLYYAQ
jgi:hypothetical protein